MGGNALVLTLVKTKLESILILNKREFRAENTAGVKEDIFFLKILFIYLTERQIRSRQRGRQRERRKQAPRQADSLTRSSIPGP